MNWFLIITGVMLEIVGLFVVVRLWQQKRRRAFNKLFWTAVLLIPFFGLLIYGFLTVNPQSQNDHTEDTSGAGGSPPSF